MNPINNFKNPLLIFEAVTISALIVYGYCRYPRLDFWTIASTISFLAGGIINLTARYHLGSAFSIMPQAKKLVTRGLYAKIRHPIYYSVFLIYAGLSLLYRHWVIYLIFVIIIVIQTVRIKKEEALLAKIFGQNYLDYKSSTWF